jgi:hypothetical protein
MTAQQSPGKKIRFLEGAWNLPYDLATSVAVMAV